MMEASTDLERHRLALSQCAAGMWTAAQTAQHRREQGDGVGESRMHLAQEQFAFALVVYINRYLRALGAS